MKNRTILEKYVKKFDNSEKARVKELRLNQDEIRELHLAITKLLLDNAEISLQNQQLISGFVNQKPNANMDGGSFV